MPSSRPSSRAHSPELQDVPDAVDYEDKYRRLHHLQRPSRPNSRSRSSSPGLFSRIGLAAPSLEVHLLEDQLYLKPTLDESEPSVDPLLQGTVTLWLPKPRTLRHLSVQLLGRQDIGWADNRPYETSIILDREVTLHDSLGAKEEQAHLKLDKGEHTFEFSILVPSSTPTYERSPYGRVRHRVIAKSRGLGKMGTDCTSVEKELFLVVNPGGAGVSIPPPALHARIEGSLDTITPFGIELQSQHMMVGGLLLLRFNLLPLADRPLVIASITLTLRQYFSLQSPTDPTHYANPEPDNLHLAQLDSAHPPNNGRLLSDTPPHHGSSGTSTPAPLWSSSSTGAPFTLKHLVRLPKDTKLRPSTLPGTKAWISLRHVAEVEVLYHTVSPTSGEMSQQQRVAVSKPLEIYSCGAHLPSLMLPEYSFDDPLPQGPPEVSPYCLCALRLERLIERHGKALLLEQGSARLPKLGLDGRTEGLVDHVG